MTILSEIAATLKTTEANAINRVMRMKLFVTYCGRCGGSGSYSWNAKDGSKCYGCNGLGAPMPKAADYPAILIKCEEAAADGRLDQYIKFQDALRVTKRAREQAMKAWTDTGISNAYKWQNAAEFSRTGNPEFKRDHEISNINAKMYAAYETVNVAASKLNSRSETYQQDVIAFAETVKQALDAITIAEVEFQNYLQK